VFSSGWLPNQKNISDRPYEYMKKNAALINDKMTRWIAMAGKEDIAYENCQVMLSKFKELNIRYTYQEYPGGPYIRRRMTNEREAGVTISFDRYKKIVS
jgi:hypothetical protein